MISGRTARTRLAAAGVTDRQARLVLTGGLAGSPVATSYRHLFDEARVDALASRRLMTPADLELTLPHGAFVARRDDAALQPSWSAQRDVLAGGYGPIGLGALAVLLASIEVCGSLPLIGTVAGFVYFGADLVSIGLGEASTPRLVLRQPTEWFDAVRATRIPTPAGRRWHLLGEDRILASSHRPSTPDHDQTAAPVL